MSTWCSLSARLLGAAGAARVVWCTRIGDAFQLGAMFDEVSEEQGMEMFLHFLDGTMSPSRSPRRSLRLQPEDKDNPFRR